MPVNIAGVPALSLPCGMDSNGLPIAAQFIGPHFSEALLYRTGRALEKWADDELRPSEPHKDKMQSNKKEAQI